jgi:glycosyltransferase involved in cell wall biosynthesis
MAKTSIFFVVPDLYSGGAQRVFMNLVRTFDRIQFQLTLVILLKPESNHYAGLLPDDIRVIHFNFAKTRQASLALLKLIRTEKPQVVFSTLTHLNFILGIIKIFVGGNIMFVARESSIISSSLKDEKFSHLFRFLYSWVYRNFDLVICQSQAMADDIITNFKLKTLSIKVIYNPVDINMITSRISEPESKRNTKTIQFLCVGRLHQVKGYDRLFQALLRVNGLDYNVRIIGDGPLKVELSQLVSKLGLDTKVTFVGIQENPFQFMRESDCLLMASYYEGLPNVVLEANACGLPVIAFDAPGGIREIIVDGLNGWVIQDGDLNAFANRLEEKEYLAVDKSKIRSFVTEKFSLNKITRQYEQAILSLITA